MVERIGDGAFMNILKISVCVAVGAIAATLSLSGSTSARAGEPATRPAASSSSASAAAAAVVSDFGLGGGGGGMGYYGGMQRGPHDWEDMMSFMSSNAPNRARVLNDLSTSSEPGLKHRLLMKWRAYNVMTERFPKMATLYVMRVRIEDDIFGLTMQAKQYPSSRAQIYTEIHDKVAALVDLGIQERKLRIEHMQDQIAMEKMKLTHDQDRRDDLVEERMTRLLDKIKNTSSSDGGHADASSAEDSPVMADVGLMIENQ
jgi:hypothetical protein